MKIAIRLALLIFSIVGIADAHGTDLEIRGNVSYQTVNNQNDVQIRMETIVNNSPNTTSGTVHIRLFATPTPDLFQSGYILADVNLGTFASNNGQLAPGSGYTNIDATVPFNRPPDGTYYLHLYVSEFPDLSTVLDYRTFSGTTTWGNAGGGGGDDHSDFFETATALNPNGTMPGTIETAGDIDMFRLNLSSTGSVSISTSGTTDTTGVLYDASRRELASDDDSGNGTNFSIGAELAAGTYYIKVSGFSDFDTGMYTVVTNVTASTGGGTNTGGGDSVSGGGGSLGPLMMLCLFAATLISSRKKFY